MQQKGYMPNNPDNPSQNPEDNIDIGEILQVFNEETGISLSPETVDIIRSLTTRFSATQDETLNNIGSWTVDRQGMPRRKRE